MSKKKALVVARIANPGTLSERIGNPRYDESRTALIVARIADPGE